MSVPLKLQMVFNLHLSSHLSDWWLIGGFVDHTKKSVDCIQCYL